VNVNTRRAGAVSVSIICAVALGACTSGGGGPSSSSGVSNATKLADLGGDPNSSAAIQKHLSSLDAKCTENETALAGFINFAYDDLRKHSVGESMAAVAAHIDKSVPPGAARINCQRVVAAFLVLTEPGR
jgi:hypothetical protein